MTKAAMTKLETIALDGVVRNEEDLIMAHAGGSLFRFPLYYTTIPDAKGDKVKNFNYYNFYKGLDGCIYTEIEIDIPNIKENYKKAKGMLKNNFDETTNYKEGVFSLQNNREQTIYFNSKFLLDIVYILGEDIKFEIPESHMKGTPARINGKIGVVHLFPTIPKFAQYE